MPQIDINQSEVSRYSSSIESGAASLQSKTLATVDNESTITGNKECQVAFEKSQAMLAQLMGAVNREASMIQQLGTDFSEADNCLAKMVSSLSS